MAMGEIIVGVVVLAAVLYILTYTVKSLKKDSSENDCSSGCSGCSSSSLCSPDEMTRKLRESEENTDKNTED